MKEQIKSFLNEDQDPKAIEKITQKLQDLLMKNEAIGYIGVQKKPAITVFPDSIVMTNKRIIMCKPKNLGLSMDFIDYDWDDISGTFVKENILGSQFSFSTKTDLVIDIDYIPKNQAKKLYTFAKEQLDLIKNPFIAENIVTETIIEQTDTEAITKEEDVEEYPTEEVSNFSEIIPSLISYEQIDSTNTEDTQTKVLSNDDLFAKLQNYKKLLDNGLIMQGEYDIYKKDILSQMN